MEEKSHDSSEWVNFVQSALMEQYINIWDGINIAARCTYAMTAELRNLTLRYNVENKIINGCRIITLQSNTILRHPNSFVYNYISNKYTFTLLTLSILSRSLYVIDTGYLFPKHLSYELYTCLIKC